MVKSLRRAIKRIARRFGYDIVPSHWMPSAVFAVHLRELFADLQIDCVLDVGANRGQYHDFLREFVEYRGRVISFEPIAEHVAFLRQAAQVDPLWDVHGIALGHFATTMELNVMVDDPFSSFLQPDHVQVRQFNGENVVHHVQRVDVRRLDSVLPELRRRFTMDNVYLKVDTQGFDLQVIEGAGAELSTMRALQTELAFKKLYVGMPDYHEALDRLESKGFDISSVFLVSADAHLRAIEADCVMVNKRLPGEMAPDASVFLPAARYPLVSS